MRIEKEDIILRSWQKSDAERLAQIANNKKIYDNLRDYFPHPYSVEDANSYIESLSNGDSKQLILAIEYEGLLVGNIGVLFQTDVYRRNGEIGYFLAEEYWGKGIMTKAIQAITAYVFENYDIERIYAEPFFRNMGSRRSLEKAGFYHEATLKKSITKNGVTEDGCIYALLRNGE
ncbi:MAG: GNAT family protein [Syntrophomonadaceae bacterium]|nr:GNAT family protein [Syntrophomonadaceae bacterium]